MVFMDYIVEKKNGRVESDRDKIAFRSLMDRSFAEDRITSANSEDSQTSLDLYRIQDNSVTINYNHNVLIRIASDVEDRISFIKKTIEEKILGIKLVKID